MPPTRIHSQKRPVLPSCPFFKCILIFQGGFTLAFQTCIYHALIRLHSPITYSFSITILSQQDPPIIQQLTVHYIILYSYVDGMFQYFSFSNIFFLSPSLESPSDRSTKTILFSLSLYLSVHLWSNMYLCVRLT
jgi:hypothetical protein